MYWSNHKNSNCILQQCAAAPCVRVCFLDIVHVCFLDIKAWAEHALMSKKHTEGHTLTCLKYVTIASFDPGQL